MKTEAFVLSDIKTNCMAKAIKLYVMAQEQREQWRKTELRHRNSVSNKGAITNERAKDCLANGASSFYGEKNKTLHDYLTPQTKVNSRWVKNLNEKDKTRKLIIKKFMDKISGRNGTIYLNF